MPSLTEIDQFNFFSGLDPANTLCRFRESVFDALVNIRNCQMIASAGKDGPWDKLVAEQEQELTQIEGFVTEIEHDIHSGRLGSIPTEMQTVEMTFLSSLRESIQHIKENPITPEQLKKPAPGVRFI